ncbi:hypothetical protein RJ639_039272 [Escallonia herrerae]|uniref:Reverse transcriptase domain-containing protein n=1 Tax=Escallonia herrerae TaxID=1293975 RepID=A0AA88WIM8_9ASTE|nr:hypothetical protein RJ639_039272 [Escallonia herrerae]
MATDCVLMSTEATGGIGGTAVADVVDHGVTNSVRLVGIPAVPLSGALTASFGKTNVAVQAAIENIKNILSKMADSYPKVSYKSLCRYWTSMRADTLVMDKYLKLKRKRVRKQPVPANIAPRISSGVSSMVAALKEDREDIENLSAIPFINKISNTLKKFTSLRAPEPNSMPALFYKSYWKIVRSDVCNFIQDFFSYGTSLQEVNHSNIALIPKVKAPFKAKHYRPIRLCNVVYKVILKIMANKLRPILAKMISLMQAAFMPGRLINDNNSIVQEIEHTMKEKKGVGLMAINIDMEKAYAKIEW